MTPQEYEILELMHIDVLLMLGQPRDDQEITDRLQRLDEQLRGLLAYGHED